MSIHNKAAVDFCVTFVGAKAPIEQVSSRRINDGDQAGKNSGDSPNSPRTTSQVYPNSIVNHSQSLPAVSVSLAVPRRIAS